MPQVLDLSTIHFNRCFHALVISTSTLQPLRKWCARAVDHGTYEHKNSLLVLALCERVPALRYLQSLPIIDLAVGFHHLQSTLASNVPSSDIPCLEHTYRLRPTSSLQRAYAYQQQQLQSLHPATMPPKSHHRSRSSVDRVFDLLADLPDNQISLLLDEFNHTTASNVPVTEAISLFDSCANKPKPKRPFDPSSAPMKTLQAELERRNSRRISSAPNPIAVRSRATPEPPTHHPAPVASVAPVTQPAVPESPPPLEPSDRPILTLSPPESQEEDRPKTASSQRSRSQGRRSYKRISRPFLLSPTATAELHQLLLAYFQGSPTSATTTATASPVTPMASPRFGLFFPTIQQDIEDGPGLDLLEPSPTRLPAPVFTAGRISKQPSMESMNSIFEVLASR